MRLHCPEPLHPSVQRCPHVPQLFASVFVLTQLEPHQVVPVAQQLPLLQWGVAPAHA